MSGRATEDEEEIERSLLPEPQQETGASEEADINYAVGSLQESQGYFLSLHQGYHSIHPTQESLHARSNLPLSDWDSTYSARVNLSSQPERSFSDLETSRHESYRDEVSVPTERDEISLSSSMRFNGAATGLADLPEGRSDGSDLFSVVLEDEEEEEEGHDAEVLSSARSERSAARSGLSVSSRVVAEVQNERSLADQDQTGVKQVLDDQVELSANEELPPAVVRNRDPAENQIPVESGEEETLSEREEVSETVRVALQTAVDNDESHERGAASTSGYSTGRTDPHHPPVNPRDLETVPKRDERQPSQQSSQEGSLSVLDAPLDEEPNSSPSVQLARQLRDTRLQQGEGSESDESS